MYYSPHGIASRILHGAASICPFRSEWSTQKNICHFKECYHTIYIDIFNKCFQLNIKMYIIKVECYFLENIIIPFYIGISNKCL